MLARGTFGGCSLAAVLALLSSFSSNAQPASAPTVDWIDSVWASHLVARAQAFKGDPVFAEAFLRDALRVAPRSALVIDKLGRQYERTGQFVMQAATAAYGQRAAADNQTAWSGAWSALQDRITKPPREPALAPEPAAAQAAYDTAYAKAQEFVAGGNFLRAEIQLRNLLLQYPRHPGLLLNLGGLYELTGDWAMYTLTYAYFHELYPDNLDIATHLASGLARLNLPGQALALLDGYLAAQPGQAGLLGQCSLYALAAGKDHEAEDYARRRLELEPESPDALNALARALIARKRYVEAWSLLEKSTTLQPARLDTQLLAAEWHLRNAKPQDAVKVLKSVARQVSEADFLRIAAQDPFRALPGIGTLWTEAREKEAAP